MSAREPSDAADFYVTGGTLRADAPSYVPRQADDDLYASLTRGEFCYVLTSRQMGKSSLMVRAAKRLHEDGVNVVALDLTAFGSNVTPDQWYAGLLAAVGARLDIEDELDDFWEDNQRLGPLHRWMEALRRVALARIAGRIVIFVDEIDMVRSLPFSTNEFFAAIRECYTRRADDPTFDRLTFCLIGVATPSELIDDPRVTPFNIGTRIELSDFQADEAEGLARGLGRGTAADLPLVERVLHWTGGHPYLTQRLCGAVAADATVTDDAGVDRLCEELFFSERAQQQDDNLQFVRNQMLGHDTDPSALLSLYLSVLDGDPVGHDDTNPLVNVLRLSGIVAVDGGALRVRNRIYQHVFGAEWADENMPDAEFRRQREIAAQAREAAAHAQIERGVQVLDGGDATGLLHLLTARRNTAPDSPLRGSAERLWAGWQAEFGERLDLVIQAPNVCGIAFHPRRDILVAACETGAVCLFDSVTGAEIHEPMAIADGPSSVAFSPDGSLLAVGDYEGRVRVWATEDWSVVYASEDCKGYVRGVSFSRDGAQMLTTDATPEARLYDTRTWSLARSLKAAYGRLWSPGFSPNGALAVVVSGSRVYVFETATGTRVKDMQYEAVIPNARFSADGSALMICITGDRVEFLSTDTWEPHASPFGSEARDFAMSDDYRRTSIRHADGSIGVYDATSGASIGPRYAMAGFDAGVFDPRRARLAVSSAEEHCIWVWRVGETTIRPQVIDGVTELTNVVYSPDGEMFAVGMGGGGGRRIQLYDSDTLEPQASPPSVTQAVTEDGLTAGDAGLTFAPDGRTLVTATHGPQGPRGRGSVHVWDVVSGRQIAGPYDAGWLHGPVAFSPDGKQAAVSGTFALHVWDISQGMWSGGSSIAEDFCRSGVFSPTEPILAVLTLRGVALRSTETYALMELLPSGGWDGPRCAAFTSDGRHLVVGQWRSDVEIWSMESQTVVGRHIAVRASAKSVSIDPEDQFVLVTEQVTNSGRLWDLHTRLPVGTDIPNIGGAQDRPTMRPNGSQFAVAISEQDRVEIHQMPCRPGSMREMEVRTWLSVGYRLDKHDESVPISAQEWRDLREELAAMDHACPAT